MDNLAYLNSLKDFTKFEAMPILGSAKVRCMKEDGKTVFVYGKGKRRYGWRYPVDHFLNLYSPIIVTDEMKEAKWKKDITRALKEINRTGLWKNTEVHLMLKNLLTMSWEDREALKFLYSSASLGVDAFKNPEIAPYVEKYPFAFKTADGITTLRSDFIYEISDIHLKSMYFGPSNKRIKDDIARAISERRDYSDRGQTSYDVSFEQKVSPEGIMRAWYSEEYRGCGNGHYYLALSEKVALFVEND